MLTKDSTLNEAVSLPGMKEYEDVILMNVPGQPPTGDVPISRMDSPQNPLAIDAANVVYGLNKMAELVSDGKVRQVQVYSEDEIREVPEKGRVVLTCFLGNPKGAFAVLCSGGGYAVVSNITEAIPTAAALYEMGYNCLILQYRTAVNGAAVCAKEDLHRAIKVIFNKREELGIGEHYAMFGFSAGGHLVSVFGTDNLGYMRVVTIADEEDRSVYDSWLSKFQSFTTRFDAAEVQAEIDRAREIENELKKQAKKAMREKKKEEFDAKINAKKAELKEKFDAFKAKQSK